MNLNHDENPANITAPNQKTKFGTLYAVILIGLLVLMGVGQFFFPVANVKSSNDEKRLRNAVDNASAALSAHSSCSKDDCNCDECKKKKQHNAKDHYKYKDFLTFNIASNSILVNENDYLEPDFLIAANHSKYPISFKDEKRLDSVIENVKSESSESNYNFDDFISYDLAKLITKEDVLYFITSQNTTLISALNNSNDKDSYEYGDIICYDLVNVTANETESRNFSLSEPYTIKDLKNAIKYYYESENDENKYNNSDCIIDYDVLNYLDEQKIMTDVLENGVLKAAIENAKSVNNEADYKYGKFLCYDRAKTAVENNAGGYFIPKTDEEMIDDAMSNALRVENESEYEFGDILDYHLAKSLQKVNNSYQICNIKYSIPLENNNYPLSLAKLAFKSDYRLDVSCNDNHSSLIISGIAAISFICLIICATFIIIGIIQIFKNTNKACTTLVIAFIPMIIAKLAILIPIAQIKNFHCMGIVSERITIINDPAHTSIILFVMLIVSIFIPIISLKLIHRT